jgi:hypothetical protein
MGRDQGDVFRLRSTRVLTAPIPDGTDAREKMVMGRPAAASAQPGDPFAVDEDRALAELELAWSDGGYHSFGQGRARRRCAARRCAFGFVPHPWRDRRQRHAEGARELRGFTFAEQKIVRYALDGLAGLEAERVRAGAPPAAGRFSPALAGLDVIAGRVLAGQRSTCFQM